MTTERPLGPLHVAAVVVGATVGVGIFFTPATLARALPSPAWVLGVQPGSMAIVALVQAEHVGYLSGPLPPWARTTIAIFAIASFTIANLLGLRTGGRIQVMMAALK